MIVVTGSVTARPEAFEALLEASLAHVRRSRLEGGCLSHAVHIDAESPMRLVFLETWSDAEALRAHFLQTGSREFVEAVRALAAGPPDLHLWEARPLAVPG